MSTDNFAVCVPWHDPDVMNTFSDRWGLTGGEEYLIAQQDLGWKSCAISKNKAIQEAMRREVDVVVILDSDCLPTEEFAKANYVEPLAVFARRHVAALEPQVIEDFCQPMTKPLARGIPYFNRSITVPVAASLGWWQGMPDRDAARQLAEGVTAPMEFNRGIVYGRPTMLCGMNIAFRPREWWPFCQFIDVNRMDDVFMSWLWCKEAARRGYCFNFGGPDILHSRQSNVWASLRDEARYLEQNESCWRTVWESESTDYDELRKLLPV